MPENEKVGPLQGQKSNRVSRRIQKLNFKTVGRINLYHRAYLADNQPLLRPIIKESNHIQEFCRAILHLIYLARSR